VTQCEKNIYVGQTGDKFYQRMLLNFSKIRTQKVEDPVNNIKYKVQDYDKRHDN
jgi:hypothetical protein